MREKYIFLKGRTVDERINEALNHKRVFKAVDVEQYVDGWLRRDQVYVQERSQPHDVSQPGPDKYQRELERQRVFEERKRVLGMPPRPPLLFTNGGGDSEGTGTGSGGAGIRQVDHLPVRPGAAEQEPPVGEPSQPPVP